MNSALKNVESKPAERVTRATGKAHSRCRIGSLTSLYKQHMQGTAVLLAAQVAAGIALAAFNVLAAKQLGATGRGVVALATTSLGLLTIVGGLGLGPAVVKYVREQRMTAKRAWTVTLRFSLGSGLVFGLGFFLAAYVTGITAEWAWVVGAIAVLTPAVVLGQNARYLVLAQENHTRYAALSVIDKVLPTVVVGIALILGHKLSVGGYLNAVLFGASVAALLSAGSGARTARQDQALRAATAEAQVATLGREARRIWIGNLAQMANYRLDIFLVAAFAGTTEAGVYALAVSISSLLSYPAEAAGAAIYPRVCGADRRAGSQMAGSATRAILLLTAAFAAAAATLGFAVLPGFFGAEFGRSAWCLLLLAPGAVALTVPKIIAGVLVSFGAGARASTGALISLGVTLVGNLALIPPFGALGAAATSSLAYIVYAMFVWTGFLRFREEIST